MAANSPDINKVDRFQLKILLKNYLIQDWRGSSNPFTALNPKKSKFPGMLALILINLFFSIMVGVMMIFAADIFSGLVVGGVGAMSVLAMQILIEFGNIIISSDDYHIISRHPVNTRTFYISKVIHFIIYVTILSLSLSVIPSIIVMVKRESLFYGPLVVLYIWIGNMFVGVLMANLYSLAMKSVNRRKMERILSYVQFLFLLLFYFGYQILPRYLKTTLASFDASQIGWAKFLPSYWFASWIEMILNGWDNSHFQFGMIGILALFVLFKLSLSYLSLSYAESLANLESSTVRVKKSRIPKFISDLWQKHTGPELKAIGALTMAQFKNDNRFQINMIWVPAMLIFSIVYGLAKNAPITDPFLLDAANDLKTNKILPIVLAMVPYMVHSAMHYSKSWKASWIFFASPADRVKIVGSFKKITLIFFMIPLGFLVFLFFAYTIGDVLHSLLHTLFILNLIWFGVNFISIFSIRIPFSQFLSKGFSLELFASMTVSMVILSVPLFVINSFGYGGYDIWFGMNIVLLIGSYIFSKVHARRVQKKVLEWELLG